MTLGVFASGGSAQSRAESARSTMKALAWAIRLCYSLQKDAEFLFEAGAAVLEGSGSSMTFGGEGDSLSTNIVKN